MSPLEVIVETREDALRWAMECNRRANLLIADGRRAILRCEEAEDVRSLQQLRYYWGPMLGDISEQARTIDDDGVMHQWTKDCWHEYGKRQFLKMRIKRVRVAGRKNPVVTRTIGSTKDLSVRQMSKYLEKFMAYAVTDLNVRFRELRWEEYGGE